MAKKTLLSWSSGKDSAWALHLLKKDPDVELVGLFTTINQEFGRVAMHGVRFELLQQQAKALGLPLQVIEIPYPCSNEDYAKAMSEFVEKCQHDGIESFAFGDLFLEDIRQYREDRLVDTGIEPIFPLWKIPTDVLSQQMIESGLKVIITCLDPAKLAASFGGREYDAKFINDLPEDIDPCGEYGEFHSFVYDGPMFDYPLQLQVGETVERDGFVFTDLMMED